MSKFLNMNGKGNNDQRMEIESHSTANGNDEIAKSVSLLTIKDMSLSVLRIQDPLTF